MHQFPISKIEYSNRLQLNIEGKRLSLFHKPFKLFKIQNFSDLFIKGNKLRKHEISKSNQRNFSADKVTSKYKLKLRKQQSSASAGKVVRKEKEKAVRKNFETILIQPQSTEVSDYVQSLSNFTRTSSESFINLNDLKKCLKLSENERSSARFLEICNDIDDLKFIRSSSFTSL